MILFFPNGGQKGNFADSYYFWLLNLRRLQFELDGQKEALIVADESRY